MKIWNGIDALPRDHQPVVASIGNYDGVHLGHQAILQQVVRDAEARRCPALLITFEPHPLTVVAPERRPRLLQSRRQKLDTLESTGLSDLLIVSFTPDVATLTGVDFFRNLLASSMQFAAIHVGENFRFGRERGGDLSLLKELGAELNFEVHGVGAVQHNGRAVSSSVIREAVHRGDVEEARKMLGRPFAMGGEVIKGEGRGKQLEYPTANLAVDNEIIPRSGVYVTEVLTRSLRHSAVTNVGVRPTFGGRHVTVESHLMDFADDLYGERIEVRFLARIRDEQRFDGATELADQIARDLASATAYFENMPLRG